MNRCSTLQFAVALLICAVSLFQRIDIALQNQENLERNERSVLLSMETIELRNYGPFLSFRVRNIAGNVQRLHSCSVSNCNVVHKIGIIKNFP